MNYQDEFARIVRALPDRTARLLACAIAEDVVHLFERERPGDLRPRTAIETSRRYAWGEASAEELAMARAAAWAAWAAAGAAAWTAAQDVAWTAARAAAWAAARDAAGAAAWERYIAMARRAAANPAHYDAVSALREAARTHNLSVSP